MLFRSLVRAGANVEALQALARHGDPRLAVGLYARFDPSVSPRRLVTALAAGRTRAVASPEQVVTIGAFAPSPYVSATREIRLSLEWPGTSP